MANFWIVCVSFALLMAVCQGDEHGDDVVQYTNDNFADEVKKNPHFVMFFAPWCGHCKRLAPTFNQLAQKHNPKQQVTIAKVDCTEQAALCSTHGVAGYPTLKYFSGDEEPIKYSGARTMEALDKYIEDKISPAEDKPAEASTGEAAQVVDGVLVLTDATFQNSIAKGHSFVKFYAPWCGHCKRLAPTWEALGKQFADIEGVNIAKVDCTEHGSVCSTHGVRGYPTLILFKDGEKEEQYSGSRDEKVLADYIRGKSNLGAAEEEKEPEEEKAQEDAAAEGVEVVNGLQILTADTFKSAIAGGSTFVKFYAPWCGHCKSLAPVWDDLAAKFKDSDDLNVAKVDCTVHRSVCSDYGVRGYPTLIFFKDGEKVDQYSGQRDLDSLAKFMKEKSAAGGEEEAVETEEDKEADGMTVLTPENFKDTVANNHALIKFYAPWCGHCKSLAPTWDKLATEYIGHDNVIIGKVDCTVHRELCGEHEVRGYPTLYYFNNGERIEKYAGGRDLQSFITYMDKHLLTVTDEEREAQKAADVSPPPPVDGSVLHLDLENFDNTINEGYTFVKFMAPWCGHCKSLAPTWTELSDSFIKNDNVKIAKVDCTSQEKLCEMQDIEGFPTLILFKDGEMVSEYEGERDLASLRKVILDKIPHDEL